MDTVQINRIARNDSEMQKYFLGVFPADKTPKANLGCMIVNEDKSTKAGTHWVALFVLPNKQAEYFDSYGKRRKAAPISQFLKEFNVTQSNAQVQGQFSSSCGQHCLYFLYHRCRGIQYADILDSYTTSQMENDEMVTEFVNEKFGLSEPTLDLEFALKQVCRALNSI